MKLTSVIAGLVVVLSCSNAPAQRVDAPVRITIHPRKIAEPELTYRLLPAASELRPGNAAQVYLLAFGQRVEGLGFPEFNHSVEAPAEEFPLEQARVFVGKYNAANALKYLELAAHRQSCNWDLPDREQGLASPGFNYLDENAQWYGGLVSLSARVAIAEGRFDRAAAALRSGFAMSRNMAQGMPLSQSMDGLYVSSLMCGDVLGWAQRGDAPNLYWALLDLPRHYPGLRTALDNEAAMLERSFPGMDHAEKLSAEESREILRRMGREIGRGDEMQMIVEMMRDYGAVKRKVVESGVLGSQAAEGLPANSLMLVWYWHEYRRALDGLTKYLALPPWQAGPAARETMNKVLLGSERPSNPLIAMLPHYPDAIVRFAVADRGVAMLATLEALRDYAAGHEGALPESLERLSPGTPAPMDPVTGKAFEYRKTVEGATLTGPAPDYAPNVGPKTWRITVAR